MTDYTKLIAALRYCKINEPCERCPLVADDDGNGKCVNELHDNAVDAIEKLVAENERLNGIIDVFVKDASAWISVKDRLPDSDDNVLAYDSESGSIDMAYYNGNAWVLVDLYECEYLHPTHWMPLPDAPEVEG